MAWSDFTRPKYKWEFAAAAAAKLLRDDDHDDDEGVDGNILDKTSAVVAPRAAFLNKTDVAGDDESLLEN